MTYPIHDPSCLSLQSGTDQRGFDYDAGDLDCDCAVICDNCDEDAVWMPDETACMRAHCDDHFTDCRACMDDLEDQAAGA